MSTVSPHVKRRPSSVRAEAEFRTRVAALGGSVTGTYAGTKVPVSVQCPQGHENRVWPMAVLRGNGICLTCIYAGWTTLAEAIFRARVTALGGTVMGPYGGAHAPVLVRCGAGHDCRLQPGWLSHERGLCAICAGQDPIRAAADFNARMTAMGATILGAYVNAHTGVRALCAAGHEVLARPHDVRKGIGICRVCAGQDPATAASAFRARLDAAGAVLLEPEWLGSLAPHRVLCAAGHECRPSPANVGSGQGACARCAGKQWDTFYVVTSDAGVKVGITSSTGRRRLAHHRAAGYQSVLRLLHDLPGDTAPELERAVLRALRSAGIRPVRGREHFEIGALALVLQTVDNYPIGVAAWDEGGSR